MLHFLRAPMRNLTAFVLVAVFGLTSVANATVLISNLPGNDLTSTFMNAPSGGSNGGGVHDSKAAGFTMPGNSYFLDYVDLRLNYFTTSSVPMVQIYSNSGTNPGTLLTTLNAPAVTVGTGIFRFTPSGSFVLNSSTTYWAVVWNNASLADSFQWFASTPSITPTGLATTAGYRFSNGPPPPIGASTTFNSYELGGTVVPEPSVVSAMVLFGAVSAIRRRRR